MGRWWRRKAGADDEQVLLRQEVERLTQENMRLRLEQQRPRNLSAVAEQLRAVVARSGEDTAEVGFLEARDEAYHVMAQTEATRRAILGVLDDLVVSAGQLQRQLTSGLPLAEVDRRVVERRTASSAAGR
ncbi:hypothetical protein [Kineococcus glutinatus]|uniref:Uncharacterized protein n=1 Tax=Kineococcus glutinatus TaxID=1070872 RepID=A0ABP9I8D1_9ACTN